MTIKKYSENFREGSFGFLLYAYVCNYISDQDINFLVSHRNFNMIKYPRHRLSFIKNNLIKLR